MKFHEEKESITHSVHLNTEQSSFNPHVIDGYLEAEGGY